MEGKFEKYFSPAPGTRRLTDGQVLPRKFDAVSGPRRSQTLTLIRRMRPKTASQRLGWAINH